MAGCLQACSYPVCVRAIARARAHACVYVCVSETLGGERRFEKGRGAKVEFLPLWCPPRKWPTHF